MTGPVGHNGAPEVSKRATVAVIALLLALLLAGGVLTLGWLVGGLIALGDRCAAHPHALTCSHREIENATSWLAYSLPPAGLIGGLIIGAVRGGMNIRRGRTGLRWAAGAWIIFAGALVLAFLLMNV